MAIWSGKFQACAPRPDHIIRMIRDNNLNVFESLKVPGGNL
jgi:hypothetical protein